MRVFITGATGFIGGPTARKLRERGDEVVVLARSTAKAAPLAAIGCEVVAGDLSSEQVLQDAINGCDAVIHAAAVYKVGIPKSERPSMFDANVKGTERVLDAAQKAGVKKIVYVSTVNIFGNTKGEVVDESYHRPGNDFLSYYDETKYLSHQVALDRIAKDAPIVIMQPGGVYGPDDHSEVGNMIDQARTGKLKLKMFPKTGMSLVYVDDVADGILLGLDKGEVGESYVIAGQKTTIGELVDEVCKLSDREPPKREMPIALMKASIPIGPLVGKAMGFPPNLRELITVSDGVTYWAKSDKAKNQLGYAPRDLPTGLKQTLEAEAAK